MPTIIVSYPSCCVPVRSVSFCIYTGFEHLPPSASMHYRHGLWLSFILPTQFTSSLFHVHELYTVCILLPVFCWWYLRCLLPLLHAFTCVYPVLVTTPNILFCYAFLLPDTPLPAVHFPCYFLPPTTTTYPPHHHSILGRTGGLDISGIAKHCASQCETCHCVGQNMPRYMDCLAFSIQTTCIPLPISSCSICLPGGGGGLCFHAFQFFHSCITCHTLPIVSVTPLLCFSP